MRMIRKPNTIVSKTSKTHTFEHAVHVVLAVHQCPSVRLAILLFNGHDVLDRLVEDFHWDRCFGRHFWLGVFPVSTVPVSTVLSFSRISTLLDGFITRECDTGRSPCAP